MAKDPTVPSKNGSAAHGRPGLLLQLAEGRTRMLAWIAGTVVFFLALTWILPENYESIGTVLPPEKSGTGGMLSVLANSIAGDFLKGTENPTLDLFKTIVESRNVATEVAKDPRIHTYFLRRDKNEDGVIGTLQGSVKGEALRTGMFTTTVDLKTGWFPSKAEGDSVRQLSSYVANKFVAELDRFNRERLMTSARNTRIFIEQEYDNRMAQLDSAYRRLQDFQDAHKTIALPEQLTATVAAAAKLTSDIQQLEMQIGVEERDLNPNSDRIQTLRASLESAKAQLAKYDDGGAGEYVLALKDVPELSRELAKYMREVKVLEQVTAYLRQELEQQRIEEQRDLPSLQVLDAARTPLTRSSPHRTVFGILGIVFGFLFGAANVWSRNYLRSAEEHPEEHYRFRNFVTAVKKGNRAALIVPNVQTASTDAASARKAMEETETPRTSRV